MESRTDARGVTRERGAPGRQPARRLRGARCRVRRRGAAGVEGESRTAGRGRTDPGGGASCSANRAGRRRRRDARASSGRPGTQPSVGCSRGRRTSLRRNRRPPRRRRPRRRTYAKLTWEQLLPTARRCSAASGSPASTSTPQSGELEGQHRHRPGSDAPVRRREGHGTCFRPRSRRGAVRAARLRPTPRRSRRQAELAAAQDAAVAGIVAARARIPARRMGPSPNNNAGWDYNPDKDPDAAGYRSWVQTALPKGVKATDWELAGLQEDPAPRRADGEVHHLRQDAQRRSGILHGGWADAGHHRQDVRSPARGQGAGIRGGADRVGLGRHGGRRHRQEVDPPRPGRGRLHPGPDPAPLAPGGRQPGRTPHRHRPAGRAGDPAPDVPRRAMAAVPRRHPRRRDPARAGLAHRQRRARGAREARPARRTSRTPSGRPIRPPIWRRWSRPSTPRPRKAPGTSAPACTGSSRIPDQPRSISGWRVT